MSKVVCLLVLLVALASVSLGCASRSSVEQLQADLSKSRAAMQSLRQEVDALKSQLSRDIDAVRSEAGDLAAQQILGDWNRAKAQSVRTQNNYQALRDSVRDPGAGAASQLNRALVRTANASALIFIADQMQDQTANRQLEVLNQCLEYILGVTSSTRSCNLAPIAP
jgi:outer membrane murein-binding lipoprotein Lpp